jgi:holo-[acyl-carrier protein] synthase
MICGIGIDIVQVSRFDDWISKPHKSLNKIFSETELKQAFSATNSAEFFASRFAAKEAFFKALSSVLVQANLTSKEFSFRFLCSCCQIISKKWNVPELEVNWKAINYKIEKAIPNRKVSLSISHEKSFVAAFVTISELDQNK